MNRLVTRILEAVDGAEPRGVTLAVGRSLLAVAGFVTIAFTPDWMLFADTQHVPTGVRCDGIRSLSLWCVTGPGPAGLAAARIVALVVLAVVAIGYRPRWTCVPQWYLTFSLGVAMTLPNGGEQIARIATMLLIPVCLGDDRIWQWTRPAAPMSPWWRGSSSAALITLRLQLAIVYGEAAVSKLLVPEWRDGTALYAVSYDPDSGLSAPLQQLAAPFLARYPVLATLTWAVIGAELTIAVGVLGPRATRRAALALVVVLHTAIVVALGLFSFGIIMIATASIACAWRLSRPRLPTIGPADAVTARSVGSRLPHPSPDPAGDGGR